MNTETKKKSTSKPAGKKGAIKKKRTGKKAPAKKVVTKTKTKGAVAQVWAVCDSMKAALTAGTKARKDVIDACVAKGLNKATAATQYQRWSKETYK